MTNYQRRHFIQASAITALSIAISGCQLKASQYKPFSPTIKNPPNYKQLFKISLAQWALNMKVNTCRRIAVFEPLKHYWKKSIHSC
jgi:hypothetical protein